MNNLLLDVLKFLAWAVVVYLVVLVIKWVLSIIGLVIPAVIWQVVVVLIVIAVLGFIIRYLSTHLK